MFEESINRLISMKKYDPSRLIYHYTNPYSALENILYTKNIKFSNLNSLNDPKERKPTYSFSSKRYLSNDELFALYDKFMRFTKIMCFSVDNEKQFINSSDNNPFHGKGFNHPRMWAQYSNNHRGICIVFDRDKLYKKILSEYSRKRILCGRVKYSDKYLSNINIEDEPYSVNTDELDSLGIDEFYIRHQKKHSNIYFFSKHSDWKDECEYRIVLLDSNSNDRYIDIKESIVAIILGYDFPMCYKETLINQCREMKIDVFKIEWYQGFAKNLNSIYDHE